MSDKIKILRTKEGRFLIKTSDNFDLIIKSIPKVFTIQPDTSRYLDVISHSNNSERMLNAWVRTGNQMKTAFNKYQVQNDKKKSKLTA
jgi:hypothetical protein